MKHPDCHEPERCRITDQGGVSTCMAWSPTYDGNGKLVDGRDPNWVTWGKLCSTCGRRWSEVHHMGEVTIRDDAR